MIPHFIDIGEMKNSYFKHFSIKSIFNPLELVEWISKNPKNMNFFFFMHRFWLLIPHFVGIKKTNNSCFKHFSLNSIFKPLELVEWTSKSLLIKKFIGELILTNHCFFDVLWIKNNRFSVIKLIFQTLDCNCVIDEGRIRLSDPFSHLCLWLT